MNLSDRVSVNNAILGSWHTTPRPIQLSTLLMMYRNGGWDPDNYTFTKSINLLEFERNQLYSSKIDVTYDLDNIFSDQHKVCSVNSLGHSSDIELGFTDKERDAKDCYVTNSGRREYYSLSWDDIEEATDNDEFLDKLRHALMNNDTSAIAEHLKGKSIHYPESKNGLSAIKHEDL